MRVAFWPKPHTDFASLLEICLHAEQTGWDRIYFADHFMPSGANTLVPTLEAWTTLAALGARVPRVELATLVTGNTYRHPAVLAKMAANLDQITGGRAVLGLGSGWQENEHRAYGIEYFDIPTRIDRLGEACELIRSLFSQEKTSFAGKHYQCEDAPLDPKPVRDKLPILVGGGGVKKTLRIVARFADEWNIWGDPQELREKGAILARHCDGVGRDPAEISHSAVALFFMTDDPEQAAKLRGGIGGRPTLAGNPDQISETIEQYRKAGVDEIVVPDFTLGEGEARREVLDRFIEEVAPRFR